MPAAVHVEFALTVAFLPAIRAVIPGPAEIDRIVVIVAVIRIVIGAAGTVTRAARAIHTGFENRRADTDADTDATNADRHADLG
jgi:hypothetical protein